MQQQIKIHILKLEVGGMETPVRAEALSLYLRAQGGAERVDVNLPKKLIRVISFKALEVQKLQTLVLDKGFTLEQYHADPGTIKNNELQETKINSPWRDGTTNLIIGGMTCRSCEISIERGFRKIKGVERVDVNAATGKAKIIWRGHEPDVSELQAAISDGGYKVKKLSPFKSKQTHEKINLSTHEKPSFWRLVALFAIVFFLGKLLSRFGILKPQVVLGSTVTFGAAFLLGLGAGSSSCAAVAGGLLLSSAARFRERYGLGARAMRPVFMFVAGRVTSYAGLGGLIGLAGKALSPSPLVTGAITILAALYMLIMGLEMLGRAPRWMRRFMPKMPKMIAHKVMDAEGGSHALAPFLLGAGTFFLPCGFTQALQIYVLGAGSFAAGAMILGAFALGTSPLLLGLGWAEGSLKGRAGKLFFQFSGALVVLLGIWNIQNGFAIAGYPLPLPNFIRNTPVSAAGSGINNPNVVFDGQTQTMTMAIEYSGYLPNEFTIRAGVPTRWVIDGTKAGGCLSVIQAPRLGIKQLIRKGENVIEFTPSKAGQYAFSCSMGMFTGVINAVDT